MSGSAIGSDRQASAPVVSVIIPTHGRPQRLAAALQSLAGQTLPVARFEVIVVDDGSPAARQPTIAVLAAGNQQLRRQRCQGPAAARNTGAAQARGDMLAFIDDDCKAGPEWLAALLAAHAQDRNALLGGRTCNGVTDSLFSDVAESLLLFLDEETIRRGGPASGLDFVASNNIAMARQYFEAIGGFDAKYPLAAGEDRDFCRRWQQRGGSIRRVDAAVVQHFHDLDLAGFWRQQRHYGQGAAQFHRRTPPFGGLPQSPGFYARLLWHPLRRRDWPWPRRLAALPITALSQLAIAAGLWRERRRQS